MEGTPGVQPDRPAPFVVAGAKGKPQLWSDQQAEATRLAAVAAVDGVQAEMELAMDHLRDGLDELDFQHTIAALRKVLIAGLGAKEVADLLLAWYGPEAVGL